MRIPAETIADAIVGFDARVAPEAVSTWPSERRGVYLLRPEVAVPLSVDVHVWPSLFDTGQGRGLPEAERNALGIIGIPAPAAVSAHLGLWPDLGELTRALDAFTQLPPHWIIAVGLSATPPGALEISLPRSGEWEPLGFDVADTWLLSGLTNCGYTDADLAELRPCWAPRLDDCHLFARLEDAAEYAEITDRRVPEHAPFFPYSLYRWRGACEPEQEHARRAGNAHPVSAAAARSGCRKSAAYSSPGSSLASTCQRIQRSASGELW